HDVVGHSLAVIGIQAEAARVVMPASPTRADEALEVIAQTSRRAIDEVHTLVDVLRADDAAAPRAQSQAD
ncbi:Histidine kinase, partial [human gut metagenome]